MSQRPPIPPFTHETAVEKVRLAEDAWNTRDPEKVRTRLHRRQPLAKPGGVHRGSQRSLPSSPESGIANSTIA